MTTPMMRLLSSAPGLPSDEAISRYLVEAAEAEESVRWNKKRNRRFWKRWLEILVTLPDGQLRDMTGWRAAYAKHLRGEVPPPEGNYTLQGREVQ